VSDAAEEWGVPLAALSAGTVSELRRLLPDTAAVHNPVDPTPVPDSVFYQAPGVLLADPGVDIVLLTVTSLSRSYQEMPRYLRALGEQARQLRKTLIVSYFSPGDRLARETEADLHASCGILFFGDPVLAIRALGRGPAAGPGTAARSGAGEGTGVPSPGAADGRVLPWREAAALLGGCGLRPVPTVTLNNRDEAAQYCRATGQIVLKVDDPAMPHKTEHAAVRLDIRDAPSAAAAFDDLDARRSRTGRVIAQEYISGGAEVVIGCWTDPELGKVVSLNVGGTLTEIVGAPVIGACPLSVPEAMRLLENSLAGRLLSGYRGTARLPLAAVAAVASAVSECFATQQNLRELEINPLVVRGDGAHIVDILAVVAEPEERSA
jgi:acyl-CoA synthetase (NDP forming)